MNKKIRLFGLAILLLALSVTAEAQRRRKNTPEPKAAEWIAPSDYASLSYRYIGPDGNRIISTVGEPGNDLVVYAGAASGGVFKSEDGGIKWKPIFDAQDVSSIGAMAIAPTNHNIVWV